jgi:hypothetical protein
MKKMTNINKLKKVKSNYPVLIGKNFISAKDCKKLIKEITITKTFDDLIHGGRNRINKGSKNFKNYLNKSDLSRKLYSYFNSKPFYNSIDKKFKDIFKNSYWSNTFQFKKFLKKKYTNKKFMNSVELSKMYGKIYNKPSIHLDFDFSVSKDGYKLKPHRDDVTRLYNFLIYLNDIPKKSGGSFTIFRNKLQNIPKKVFKRFPSISQLCKVKEFTPSKGTIIFFQSTPNSYHGVSLFREIKNKKRFFIYGSFALSRPVIWIYKNLTYIPRVKKTKNRLLTHSHETDYITNDII